MNSSRDILYVNYEYKNKSSYVKPEDFEEYYSKIKELEQSIAYHIYIPKSEAGNSRSNGLVSNEDFVSTISKLFYWAIGIASFVIVGLVVFVIRNNKNRT